MRTAFVFVGFVVFGLVLFFIIGNSLVDEDWLRSLGPWTGPLGVGLIIADIAIPIPTTLIITLLAQVYGVLVGGLLGTLGCFLAGLTAYGLTRSRGRGFAKWLLGDELARVETFYVNSGAFAVACSRWLPLIPEAISCLAGLARMPFGKYCASLLAGCIPMCFAYAALAKISTNPTVPLVISIVVPVPIWWIAGRLLYRQGGHGGISHGGTEDTEGE